MAVVFAGCGFQLPCASESEEAITVVLTFDDGPLRADAFISDFETEPSRLLDPLYGILGTLDRRGLRAVFYVKGIPENERTASAEIAFAQGLLDIHKEGHVLGYHCLDQDPAIWIWPYSAELVSRAFMKNDLDGLELFLDEILADSGFSRDELFTPIFRQPFGGGGIRWIEGWQVAAARGWVYHGYDIDSYDWLENADAVQFFKTDSAVDSDASQVERVLCSLEEGAARNANQQVIDILFHVNALTAEHLEEWIDTVKASLERYSGKQVIFEVPDCYLTVSDPKLDVRFVELLTE